MNLMTVNVNLPDLAHANVGPLATAIRVLVRELATAHATRYEHAAVELLGPCIEEPERNVWHVELRQAGAKFHEHWKATVHNDQCLPVHFLNCCTDETWTIEHHEPNLLKRMGRFAH